MMYWDRMLLKVGSWIAIAGMAGCFWVGVFYLMGWLP